MIAPAGADPRTGLPGVLVRLLAGPVDGPGLLDDLEEEYRERLARLGAGPARRWYRGASCSLVRAYLWMRIRHGRSRDLSLLLEARRQRRRSRRYGPTRERTPRLSFPQDARFALRTLRRRPGFTLAAMLTIALGIGANTAIFTVLNGVALRPLPFPDSERVVIVSESHPSIGEYWIASPPNVEDWSGASRTIEVFGLARDWPYMLRQGEGTSLVRGAAATPGWFEVLGLRPALGRLFTPDDLTAGGNRVTILSHAFWRQRFEGDPGVIGSRIVLDEEPFLVVGVLPEDAWMHAFGSAEVWEPLTAISDNVMQRDWRGFVCLGRLAPGVGLDQARAELASIQAALARQYPETNEGWGVRLERLRDYVAGPVEPLLWLFLGAVGLVLLIGCANVANLMLVRATDRRREFAVRATLGAGVGRLVRQLLTESLLLAFAGGGLGLLLGAGIIRLFLGLTPPGIPRLAEVGLDGRVLLFALAVTLMTALLFGLIPALRGARADLMDVLRTDRGEDRRMVGFRRALVVIQLSLALALLAGAGLMIRGFVSLLAWDPGFDRHDLVTVWALAPSGRYESGDAINDLFEQAAAAVRALPEVAAVGMTSSGPLFGGRETDRFEIVGRPPASPDELPSARWYDIDPDYFAALGIRLLRGRGVTAADVRGAPPVAVINETMARRFWPSEDPLGRQVVFYGRTIEIVGIVQDVRPFRPDQELWPEIYWPKRQAPRGATYYVIRSRTPLAQLDRAAFERTVRARVAEVEPDLQLSGFTPLETIEARQLVGPRFNMLLVAAFALMALVLAAVGIYGVIAYTVAVRSREMAVRMALGARPARVVGEVVRDASRLVGIGLLGGLAGALLLGRLMTGLIYGLSPVDPLALGGSALLLLATALVAAWLPSRRAGRNDPAAALREQ